MVDELFLPLAALALLPLLGSGSRRAVGWSLVGILLILLGVSAAVPDWFALAEAPVSFVAVSAGLCWAGIGAIAFAAWTGARGGEEFALKRLGPVGANLAITAAALVGAFLLYAIWPLLFAGGWRGVVVAAGIAASGIVVGTVAVRLRVAHPFQWIDLRWLAPPHGPGAPRSVPHTRVTVGLGLIALVVAVATPRLGSFTVALLAVTAAAHLLARGVGKAPRIPVQGILVAISGLAFLWAVWTIAGSDIPLSFPGILETPFSDAAEAALALVLGLGVWALLGLWPFHGAGPGSALAVVGGAFLIRWGTGLIPGGIVHAAPIFALVAGIATLHAAATGRLGEYVAALGVLAVLGGGDGAWGLFALASALAVLRVTGRTPPIPGLERRELGAIVLIPFLAWALPTMLTGETFVTVVAVFSGAALFRPATD